MSSPGAELQLGAGAHGTSLHCLTIRYRTAMLTTTMATEANPARKLTGWGLALAAVALLVPLVAVVSFTLGVLTAARGRVGAGVAVMVAAVVLGAAGLSLRAEQARDRVPLTCIQGVPVEAGGC